MSTEGRTPLMGDMRVRANGFMIDGPWARVWQGWPGLGGPVFTGGWRVGVRGAPHVWKHSVIAERRSRESPTLEPL